ncbi:hypothetical protein WA171_006336, partial [Blastocystis sp. BT1]
MKVRLFVLLVLVGYAVAELEIEEVPTRIFIKPMNPVTLDVFIGDEYLLYLEDLEAGMKYTVKLSYPGVIPVQFDLFLEKDDDAFESSVHKRRIQDTRIFTFETNRRGDIFRVERDRMGVSSIITYRPILHVIPKHLAMAKSQEESKERFVTIVVEPTLFGVTPTIFKEVIVLVILGVAVFIGICLYFYNPTVSKLINRF